MKSFKATYCDKEQNIKVTIDKSSKSIIEKDTVYRETYKSIDGKHKMILELRSGMDPNNLFKVLKCSIDITKSNSLNVLSYVRVFHDEEMFLTSNENHTMNINKKFIENFIKKGTNVLNTKEPQLNNPIPEHRAMNVANLIKMNTAAA